MKRRLIISFCLSLVLALFSTNAMAQAQTVTGLVVDELGDPIIGATVMEQGTKNGVITDLDGKYSIKIEKGKKVTITYIGYMPKTVAPGGKVQLQEDRQNLEEVVVVGYGSQKKAHLTGSVATVEMEDIQDLSGAGLAATLSGMVNGLSVSGGSDFVGERAKMHIRDTNSFGDIGVSGALEPLFVIDGYIYPNDVKIGNENNRNLGAEAFNNLDPSEVESISVLKDASAAVYGARAANGVILVTTKKGKQGAPRISYNGTFGFTDAVAMPKMLSAYDYGRLYNAVAAADPLKTTLNRTTDLFQADELEAMKALNYDLLDKYWDTGFTMQHSVNVSGATDKVNYFGGISYFDQDGNLGKLDYDRWNYRAGLDVQVSDHLKANLTVSGDYMNRNKPNVKVQSGGNSGEYDHLLYRPRYIPESVGDYPIYSYGVSNASASSAGSVQNYSFDVLQNNGDFSETKNSNLNIGASLDYDFDWSKVLKGLKLRFSYSKSINSDKNNQYASEYTLYKMLDRTGSGHHLYTPVAGVDYEPYLAEGNFEAQTLYNGSTSSLSRNMSRTDNYQMNFTAQYARKFGLHDVSALFSIEKSETETEYLYGEVRDVYSFTNYQSNGAAMDADAIRPIWTRGVAGTLSYIGRVNYAYADKYLLEFLLRSDASTKFAPENYWGVFPSVSAGWIISEEKFMEKLTWIDFLKIRTSFGLTGRDNTPAWQWLQAYDIWAKGADGAVFGDGNDAAGGVIRMNSETADVNRDVHWDKSYKFNVGVDFHTLNKRLAVTLDYYRVWNREMFMNLKETVPATVGALSANRNLGEIDNWGYEVGITWRDKIGKDFKYRVTLNTGYSDNRVRLMDFETAATRIYQSIQRNGRTDVGLWGYQCIGMFRSFQDIQEYLDKYHITSYFGSTDNIRPGMLIYKDVRGPMQADGTYSGPDGVVDEYDMVQLSNRSNPYGFTINANAEWKGLSVTLQFGANWGGYRLISGSALKPRYGIEATNMPSFWNPDDMFVYQDIYDGSGNLVMAENHSAKYPNLAYTDINAKESSFWRVSDTQIRLNRMTLAYKLPTAWYKGIGIQSARINVTGQNLINFYNPYPDNFYSPMAGNLGSYPVLRKWTIGVNLTF